MYHEVLSEQHVSVAGIAERLEAKDSNKEIGDLQADKSCASLCKERVDNADQLVVPPSNYCDSVGSEVLKDVFQRFGSVKVSCKLCPTTRSPKIMIVFLAFCSTLNTLVDWIRVMFVS